MHSPYTSRLARTLTNASSARSSPPWLKSWGIKRNFKLCSFVLKNLSNEDQKWDVTRYPTHKARRPAYSTNQMTDCDDAYAGLWLMRNNQSGEGVWWRVCRPACRRKREMLFFYLVIHQWFSHFFAIINPTALTEKCYSEVWFKQSLKAYHDVCPYP